MHQKNILFVLFLCSALLGRTQTPAYSVHGNLRDAGDSSAVAGATILLSSSRDASLHRSLVSLRSGDFEFRNIAPGEYDLLISSVEYTHVEKRVVVRDGPVQLGRLFLTRNAVLLDEVVVQAAIPPVRQKDDTLEYNASAFKVNPDANADDMIRKMPGITVEQGVVKAGGEDVRKVTVDGREFFGDDAVATLKNLPAEVIDKIQVFDRLSDQAQFTGFDDGNTTKAINIITKADMRNGQFGRLYAGYGTDDRYAGGGNVSFFKGNRRLSLVGLVNNINQQNFSSEDLLGVTSQGGGGRGRGGGRGGGDFLVGQQSGISKTNALGVNFSDAWGKKLEVAGSYFFNNSSNVSNDRTNREDLRIGDSSQLYDENRYSTTRNNNHRINMRIEYKIDSNNTLLITPRLSFQDNHSFSGVTGFKSVKGGSPISETDQTNNRNSSGFNVSNNILFRHAFAKRGRTLSVNLSTSFNERNGEYYIDALNRYYKGGIPADSLQQQLTDQASDGYRISTSIAYTEPIGAHGQLQINYQPSWSKNNSGQHTYNYDDADGKYSLFDEDFSNVYDNTYNTQNGGISYRVGNRDNMLSAGLSYQHAVLSGNQEYPSVSQVSRSFRNILPNLMWRKKVSEKSSIRLMYRSGTDEPSVSQLQEAINNSNLLFMRTGNPDLKQEYSHRVMGRYTFTNSARGQSFMANVYLQQTNNYIGNAIFNATTDSLLYNSIVLNRGSQLSKPVNMDGYWSIRSFFNYGMPLRFIKSNLNWNAGYSYSKTPGRIDKEDNLSNTQNYSLGAVLASNVSEYVDFTLSYSANFNAVKNSIDPDRNDDYFSQSAGFQVTLLSKSGWFLQNDVSQQSYRGLSESYNQSFWLWNASAGKKFLKNQKADLRLTVFDLLKQNRSINRTSTVSYIEDRQTQVLQQYFMLTFSYRLRNFGKAPSRRGGDWRSPGGERSGGRPAMGDPGGRQGGSPPPPGGRFY